MPRPHRRRTRVSRSGREQSSGRAGSRRRDRAGRWCSGAAQAEPACRRLAAAAGGTRAAGETAAAAAAPAGDGRFRQLIATKVAESWREIPHFTVSREVNAAAMQKRLETLRAESVEPGPTLTDLLLVALHAHWTTAARAAGRRRPGRRHRPRCRDPSRPRRARPGSGAACALAPRRGRAGASREAEQGRSERNTVVDALQPRVLRRRPFHRHRRHGADQPAHRRARSAATVAGDDGEISVQMMFDATLNADHRVVDGAQAARLLVAFATAAETMASDH